MGVKTREGETREGATAGLRERGVGGPDEWLEIAEDQVRFRGCHFNADTYRLLSALAKAAETEVAKDPGRRTEAQQDLRKFVDRMADSALDEDTEVVTPTHLAAAKAKCGCFPWCYLKK